MNSIETKRHPLSWVPTVYFAMGLPFVALSMVSVIMLKDLGIPNNEITYWTSLLILPWSLKPFLSLIMETFGTKKIYVVMTEIISAIFFGLIVFALPLPNFFVITLAFMGVIALSGSMHDIAGDGIYLTQLDTATQSRYSGWQGAFYNMAKVLANGALVFLSGWLVNKLGFSVMGSWQVVMGIFCVILLSIGIYHLKMLPGETARREESFQEKARELWMVIKTFFCKKYIFLYIVFIFLYRFAEGLVMKIVPLFLKENVQLGGLGLGNEEYGFIYGTFGTVAFIVGSILAGYYVSRFGLKKVLFSLVCIFNIPFAVYLVFAIYQPSQLWIISLGVVSEYFGYGFGFVGIILFMMQQIAPGKYQMAHYAFANSIMNLSVMVPGMISGFMLTKLGSYENFFLFAIVCAIPIILMSLFIPFAHEKKE